MECFARIKVGSRLLIGFGLVIALGMVVAAVGLFGLQRLNAYNDTIYQKELLGISYVKEANINLIYAGRARARYVNAATEEERQQHLETFNKSVTDMKSWIEKARPAFYTDRGRALLAEVETAINEWLPSTQAYFAAAAKRQLAARDVELSRLDEVTRSRNGVVDEKLTNLTRVKEELGKQAADEGTELYERLSVVMIGLAISSALLGVSLGFVIAHGLIRQLGGEPGDVAAVANAIAAGDLTTRIDDSTAKEGSVVLAMKRMQESLVQVVSNVRRGVESVSTASGQIAAGNQDLSSRTEEQASSLQQTAASMEQLTSTVKQSSDNARQASALALSASHAASKGGEVVGQVVATMDEISNSSKKIADIIAVIDGIAFQTNILALNAAVEAARAGEQGRGFAVVAGEVRTLAQRSAQAAKEIRGLISDSVTRVEEGSRQVADAGTAMTEIVSQVKRVTDLIQEISSAAIEQSSGITQINEAVTQMDQVTQQNAALVEQSAAAAGSLREQATQLAQAVATFKLSQHEAQLAIAHAQTSARASVAPVTRAKASNSANTRSKPKGPVVNQPRLLSTGTPSQDSWQEF